MQICCHPFNIVHIFLQRQKWDSPKNLKPIELCNSTWIDCDLPAKPKLMVKTFCNNEGAPNDHCIGQHQGQEHALIRQKGQSISMSCAPMSLRFQKAGFWKSPFKNIKKSSKEKLHLQRFCSLWHPCVPLQPCIVSLTFTPSKRTNVMQKKYTAM